jgi:hypothetical protein
VGLRRDTWISPRGDGVRFTLLVDGATVFDRHLDPRSVPDDRGWVEFDLDLGTWAGREVTIAFVTSPGPRDDPADDVAGWAEPQVIQARR